MPIILGISASLRNARFGVGESSVIDDIAGMGSRENLHRYLKDQTNILLEEFFETGRKNGQPFTELYYMLRKQRGDRGLSNSEAGLVAALWGCKQHGADILYCSLANVFSPEGDVLDIDHLRDLVCQADGIILSGPVYFGDRGSLAQQFFEFLQSDGKCREHVKGKPFAGVAVGAKRNGGQETTLIYQMVDASNLNMLVVGNDHETTAQYGGTAVAGDVGTFPQDEYGLKTAISTGARLAKVANMLERSKKHTLSDKLRIGIWLLQDSSDGKGLSYINSFVKEMMAADSEVDFDVIDITREYIAPCIACDVCPTHTGVPDDYRCIIHQKNDFFERQHKRLINVDAFLLAAYSPMDRSNIKSVYQRFIERTRYLRRDDYQLGDHLMAPFVFSEIGANQNLHLRMLTSGIRHQTVLHHPLVGFEHQGALLNNESMLRDGKSFISRARSIAIGRLTGAESMSTRYQPIGYVVSKSKLDHDTQKGHFSESDDARMSALEAEKKRRVK